MIQEDLLMMVSSARMNEVVCRPVTMRGIGQSPKNEIAYCPLPGDGSDKLLAAFNAAPQFADLDAERILSGARNGIRAILISENLYYARQAAVYLTAMYRRFEGGETDDNQTEEDYEDLEKSLSRMMGLTEDDMQMKDALMVVSAALIDPRISAGDRDENPAAAMMAAPQIDLSELPTPALLVQAASGRALSAALVEKLETVCDKGCSVFIVLLPSQIDLEHINTLQLKQGFSVWKIREPSDAYLVSVLRSAVREQHRTLDPGANTDAVVAHMRRLRGSSFDETDLYDTVACASRNGTGAPLTTAELLYQPYNPRPSGRSAMDELNAMTGLAGVKEAIRRQIGAAVLARRRGKSSNVSGRSMTFAGSPGTGKSVTARLVAQIMREEGCGTGRFVEAGREQLIGKYLGYTSPKIAKLFEEARGGVLFIDEAGALIPRRSDSYAEEAVNALVRHMELEQETMVIFATYPGEMKELMDSNRGLRSRVSKALVFEDYSDEQLWEILGALAGKEGYALPEDAKDACLSFFRQLRDCMGENFGNGRESRRLLQSAIEELGLRVLNGAETPELSAADFEAAAAALLEQERSRADEKRVIGFESPDTRER